MVPADHRSGPWISSSPICALRRIHRGPQDCRHGLGGRRHALIPHAYGMTHLHMGLAYPEIPMIEYFPLPCWDKMPDVEVESIFLGLPEPKNGEVTVEARPGMGVKVNEKIFGKQQEKPSPARHASSRA
jgi:L-alanine-DL-glutamate epimerase-like enolase superfamily enzyme